MLSTSRTLAYGLVWGGWMLFILGWWLATKHEELSRLCHFAGLALAAASFGCGIWQYARPGQDRRAPEEKQAALLRQRQGLSFGLIVGGLILVGLALFLGISFKLSAFGEVAGMCLMGISAVVSGRNLLKGEKQDDQSHPFLDFLRRQHGRFGLVMAGSGPFGGGLTALGLIFIQKLGPDWLPETAGLFLLGFLGVAGGIRLTSLFKRRADHRQVAHFSSGFWRRGRSHSFAGRPGSRGAFLWRDEVFGGMRAWQGDRGWHLWLCAYVELIGLGLMFTSLLLARTDIRSSAVLRRVLYGYNAVLTGLLLLAMLVVLNIVLFALFPFSFEWSKSRGAHTLSTSTKNLLNNLREPTTIYVFLPRNMLDVELRNFLDNCQSQSTKAPGQVRFAGQGF